MDTKWNNSTVDSTVIITKDGNFMSFQEMEQNFTLCNHSPTIVGIYNLKKNRVISAWKGNTAHYVKQKWEKKN